MIHVIGSDDTSLLHLSRFLGVLLEYLFFTLLYLTLIYFTLLPAS